MSWLAEEDPLREAQAPSVRVNHVFPNSTFSGGGRRRKKGEKKRREKRKWGGECKLETMKLEGRKEWKTRRRQRVKWCTNAKNTTAVAKKDEIWLGWDLTKYVKRKLEKCIEQDGKKRKKYEGIGCFPCFYLLLGLKFIFCWWNVLFLHLPLRWRSPTPRTSSFRTLCRRRSRCPGPLLGRWTVRARRDPWPPTFGACVWARKEVQLYAVEKCS